jgi:hypothetical protein
MPFFYRYITFYLLDPNILSSTLAWEKKQKIMTHALMSTKLITISV